MIISSKYKKAFDLSPACQMANWINCNIAFGGNMAAISKEK